MKISVLTMFEDDESVFACLKPGLLGYRLKEAEQTAIEWAAAADLGLGSKTIWNLVSNVFAKLGAADKAQTIIKARAAGMGQR